MTYKCLNKFKFMHIYIDEHISRLSLSHTHQYAHALEDEGTHTKDCHHQVLSSTLHASLHLFQFIIKQTRPEGGASSNSLGPYIISTAHRSSVVATHTPTLKNILLQILLKQFMLSICCCAHITLIGPYLGHSYSYTHKWLTRT